MTGGWGIGPLEHRISWVGGFYDPTYLLPSTLPSCVLLDKFTVAFPQPCAAHSTSSLQQLWRHLPAGSMRTFTQNRLLLEKIKPLSWRAARQCRGPLLTLCKLVMIFSTINLITNPRKAFLWPFAAGCQSLVFAICCARRCQNRSSCWALVEGCSAPHVGVSVIWLCCSQL